MPDIRLIALYTRSQARSSSARAISGTKALIEKLLLNRKCVNPLLNNIDALIKLSSEHEPLMAVRGLEKEMAIFRLKTGYFSK